MRTVWKFVVPVDIMTASFTTIQWIPIGANLIHVREQPGPGYAFNLWYEVDPNSSKEKRGFQMFPSGTPDIRAGLEHIGTGLFPLDEDGPMAVHLYEVVDV